MPTITTLDEFQVYLNGVMRRAVHHAGSVSQVILVMASAVIWRKEGKIRIRAQLGEFKNSMWVYIGGNRYAISFNHKTGQIEVREKNLLGRVLRSFDNSNTTEEVFLYFRDL